MDEEVTDQLELQHSDDEGLVSSAHNKLLGAVSQLYEKKRVKASTRKEPSLEVSEFHLSQPDKKRSNRVKITDLAKVLNKRATHVEISQKLKSAQKRAKTLPKPLEKIHADKIIRTAGYEHAKRQLNRWDAIVYKQKVAEQVSFPLKSETIKVQEDVDLMKMFRKPTPLEIEMAELLKHPNPLAQKAEEKHENKHEAKEEDYPLSLAEVVEKRKIMAKLRAQQSYRQTKAMRHSKIKSKKFHQIQRRARVKEQLKEFEELQKKDPEAALKKLEELERTRAEERVTLRHRSTGQWAKNLAVRAKYDKEARIALAEQMSKSRELTVKLAQTKDSESEKEDDEEIQPQSVEEDPNNPWVVKRSHEMEEFVSGYRKYWETKGKEFKKNQPTESMAKVNNFQIQNKKSLEKESFVQENCQLTFSSKSKDDLNHVENCVPIHDDLDDFETNKHHLSKNVFVLNSAIDKNSQSKVINNQTVPMFDISDQPAKKKIVKNTNNINDNRKSEKHFIKTKEAKIKCKTGLWTVKDIKTDRTTKFKKSKKITLENYQINKDHNELNVCKETESKISTDTSGSNSYPDKIYKTMEQDKIAKKTNERIGKVKSLDELFEEVEDKLQNRIKNKFEQIKASLDCKRKEDNESDIQSETEEIPSLELKKKNILADVDEELLEVAVNNYEGTTESKLVMKTLSTASSEIKPVEDIDPNKFLKVTPRHLCSELPDIMTEGDALDDEENSAENRHLTISEAFAEDDIVDQFQKEKKEEVKKSGVGDVNLTLPGWGSWAGHNLKSVTRRKRKKFVIKFPKAIPRKDTNRGNVIINEDADKPLKQHQVSEVPYPFTSVQEYEASIRTPLGSTWVPQSAHQRLTLPPVVTKVGAVIQPMDEGHLVNSGKQLAVNKTNKKHNKSLNKKSISM